MKKIAILAAATSVVAFATPAFAQDDTPFTGPRVEALVGYDIVKAGSSVDDDGNDNNDQSMEGINYGAGIGYDFNAGGMVLGVEAEYMDSTADTDFENGDFEGFGFGNVNANRDLYIGARVGVPVQPDLLLYAKGGYTNAKFDVRSSDGTTEFNQDIDTDGWRVGAGVEYATSNNMFVKAEYRYSKYEEAEIDFDGDIPDSDRFDIDTDRHQFVVGVGFRF